MPDYRVTFVGDLGNLRAFDNAVRNSAKENARQIEAAHGQIASKVGKITGPLTADSGAGLFTTKQRTQIDAYNKTMVHTGQIIRQTIKDFQILKNAAGEFELKPIISRDYVGDYSEVIGDLDRYTKALKKTERAEREILEIRRQTKTQQLGIEQQISSLQSRKGAATKHLADVLANSNESGLLTLRQSQLDLVTAGNAFIDNGQIRSRAQIEADISDIIGGQAIRPASSTYSALLDKENAEIERLRTVLSTPQGAALQPYAQALSAEIEKLKREMAAIGEPFKQDLDAIETKIKRLTAELSKLERSGARAEAGVRRREPAYAEADAARRAIPPIQKDLDTVLRQSKELRQNLLRSGLGGGAKFDTPEFLTNLNKQEAGVARVTENIRTNTRTIQGAFKDLNTGLLKHFTVDLDQNGKVVGRWGGQLRGAGTFLKQTVRDFQKVIEWTVATTVVFGTLAAVVGQLQSINELNTSLTRFSITAQLTSEEADGLFKSISGIAFDTATPLKELVKVADDIALATREANQSTSEWHSNILALTEAVGIFTNLTGKDTVQGADLLSAAFKQLDIAPDQLTGLLSKVTAVAGGQATAISDIVQSVGGLAEAAKAAGFSIDEMIAAVQVLSQVTNKSSDEVATSFKNLFGSVTSVGSAKILSQFGIAVRDEAGEVKDFLDIYREVQNAIEQGVIPQGRIPDVLRGISGGPRRAPDAAALLGSLDLIDEVVGKAAGATNEALIANAKVLDTNQAKLVQFQNAFDTAVFERFGQAVENLTGILTSVGIELLGVFNTIPAELLSAVVSMVALAGGMRLVSSILGTSLIPRITGLGKSLRQASSNMGELINNQKSYVIASRQGLRGQEQFYLRAGSRPIPKPDGSGKFYTPGQVIPDAVAKQYGVGTVTRFSNYYGNQSVGKRIGIGAGFAAGGALATYGAAGLASGEIDMKQIGSLLQGGGALATLIPSGVGQIAGVAAIAVGTALQFLAGETEKAKQSANDLNIEIYDLTKSLQESQNTANTYAKTQEDLGRKIDELRSKESLAGDDLARLNSLSAEYAVATLGLATANQQVSKTFDELLQKIPGLAEKYQTLVQAVRSGSLSPEDPAIKDLSQKLAGDILRATGKIIYSGPSVPLSSEFNPGNFGTDTSAPNAIQFAYGGGKGASVTDRIDLSDLLDDPNLLAKLFDLNTGAAKYNIPQNELSLGYLSTALAQLPAMIESGETTITEDQMNTLVDALTAMTAEVSSATANLAASNQLRARAESNAALGIFDSKQTGNAITAANIIDAITAAQGQIKPNQGFSPDLREGASPLAGALQEYAALAQTKGLAGIAFTNTEIIDMATNIFAASGALSELEGRGETALNSGIYEWAKAAGFSVEQLDALVIALHLDLSQIPSVLEEMQDRLIAAKSAAGKTFADRSLQLLIAENSGQYEDNAAGLAMLKEQNVQAYESSVALSESITQLNETAFVGLSGALENVIGFQHLKLASDEELIAAQETLGNQLIQAAVDAGVNAEGIQQLQAEYAKLIAIINAIPDYKKVIIELQTVRTNNPGIGGSGTYRIEPGTLEALAQNKQPEIDSIEKIINKILGSGTGGGFGQLPKSATSSGAASTPYNKPGLLDIPEEILEQTNYRDLIDKAVASAKKLQSQVPGEANQNRQEIVELLNGTKRILETKGIGEEYLRRAMDELTDQIKRQNDLLAKADTIRRIRVNQDGFAAFANVPLNSQSGVSVGGPQGPINISLNMNGTVLTPAQFQQFANMVGASIKRQLSA